MGYMSWRRGKSGGKVIWLCLQVCTHTLSVSTFGSESLRVVARF